MTEFKKEPLSSGRGKLALIRDMPLSAPSPLTQNNSENQRSSASEAVASSEAAAIIRQKTENLSPVSPKININTAPAKAGAGDKVAARFPFTYAFSYELYPLAQELAAKIPCKMEDLILAVSKRFDPDLLDLSTSEIKGRVGPSLRVLLSVPSNIIASARNVRDPLGLRSDGYILRIPVVAALDVIAANFLKEVKERYES
ncbi:hypothetical protein FG152_24720 [Ochrobactrum sp. XJ1]|nr:hypothetical protein [Ochrobactrum sp. XJ1]